MPFALRTLPLPLAVGLGLVVPLASLHNQPSAGIALTFVR